MADFKVSAVLNMVDKMTAPINKVSNRMQRFARRSQRAMKGLNTAVNRVGKSLKSIGKASIGAITVGVVALTGAVTSLIKQYSKIEDAEAAFTPLLGGAEKAKKLVEDLNKTAATTPFQFETLASAAQQLLPVMKGDIDNVIATIRKLGDTAGGNAQKLDTITRGYTKAMLKGKVDMESLNMIAEAGVPIFDELAKSMGTKTGEKFFKNISKGKVRVSDLNKAFDTMTKKGGIFFGGMEIASRTTSGMWSTMVDNISSAAAVLGEALAPTIKELIGDVTALAIEVGAWAKANKALISDKFKQWVKFVKDNSSDLLTWGKRIAVAVVAITTIMVSLKAFILVMTAVNLVMAANPIGLVVAGVMLLIAAVSAVVFWWDEIKAAIMSTSDVAIVAIGLILGPIGLMIAAAALIMKHWEPLKSFFKTLGDGIASVFNFILDGVILQINVVLDMIRGVVALGQGLGVIGADVTVPRISSMSERAAQTMNETRTVSSAEILIRDQTGRAEMTTRGAFSDVNLNLVTTGAF